jgi:hypothetical protein
MIITDDVTNCVKKLTITGILLIDPTKSGTTKKSINICAQVVFARGGRIIIGKYK